MIVGNCTTCDRTMRRGRDRAADYPGTVKAAGGGQCDYCRYTPSEPVWNVDDGFDVEAVRSSLTYFLAYIRTRREVTT